MLTHPQEIEESSNEMFLLIICRNEIVNCTESIFMYNKSNMSKRILFYA